MKIIIFTPFAMTAAPTLLQFACNDCHAKLSVPQCTPGQTLEGPCPFCGQHQKFTAPSQPSPENDFSSFWAQPKQKASSATPKITGKKHTYIDVVAISVIFGLILALAGTLWAKF